MKKTLHPLDSSLKKLRLRYLEYNIDDFITKMSLAHATPIQVIEALTRLEIEEATRSAVASRIKAAKLGRKFATMADFDWSWPKSIPRETIDRLFTLSFIDEPANVILMGAPGVGKTMIAKNLVLQAATSGYSALFVEAVDMLADLGSCDTAASLKRRVAFYSRPKVLAIDEVGYLPHPAKAADLLYQVLCKRHTLSSTVITTNRAFKDWGELFASAGSIVAMVDRLTACAEIIVIDADSYRSRMAGKRRVNPPGQH